MRWDAGNLWRIHPQPCVGAVVARLFVGLLVGLVDMGGVWGGLPWVVLVRALVCSTDMGGVREGAGRVDVSNDVSNAFVCVVGSGGGGG
jgi:hypothetical protein